MDGNLLLAKWHLGGRIDNRRKDLDGRVREYRKQVAGAG
jgi:hypothetical protein